MAMELWAVGGQWLPVTAGGRWRSRGGAPEVLQGRRCAHIFKSIDVDRTGAITQNELVSYLSNTENLAPSKDEMKWRALRRASKDPKVWTMVCLCIATFFLYGELCLWGLPPKHHEPSRWIAWGLLLLHGIGLYAITYKQHVNGEEAFEGCRMELLRLAYEQADVLAIPSHSQAARRWRGSTSLFLLFDETHNGTLTLMELKDGLKRRGYITQEVVLSRIFSEVNAARGHSGIDEQMQIEYKAAVRIQAQRRGYVVRNMMSVAHWPSLLPVRTEPDGQSGGEPIAAELVITHVEWVSYVSGITPATKEMSRGIASRKMVFDHKTYQITCFLSAILILLVFFVHPWGPSLESSPPGTWGSAEVLTSVAVTNLFTGCSTGIALHHQACYQGVVAVEQSRLELRNLLYAAAIRLRQRKEKERKTLKTATTWVSRFRPAQ